MSEGSVLYRAGSTVVLCTASVDPKVPAWMEGKGKGWVTAEYQMHPRSNPVKRESRDGRGKAREVIHRKRFGAGLGIDRSLADDLD